MAQQTIDVVRGDAAVKPVVSNRVPTAATEGASVGKTQFRMIGHDETLAERVDEGKDEDTVTGGASLTGFISELNELYDFKDDLMVENFLEENASLGGLLFEAYKIIPGFFGREVEVALEVVADPESLGDQQLFILIRTELPRKEARARLAELDRGWWLNALPASEGKMEIALE